MGEHISTDETFLDDNLESISYCHVCCKKTKMKGGWIGIKCYSCGNVISGEEFRGTIAMYRRRLLGLTRPEMAKKVGLSKHTIKTYEWSRCPEGYFIKTEQLMKEHNKNERH